MGNFVNIHWPCAFDSEAWRVWSRSRWPDTKTSTNPSLDWSWNKPKPFAAFIFDKRTKDLTCEKNPKKNYETFDETSLIDAGKKAIFMPLFFVIKDKNSKDEKKGEIKMIKQVVKTATAWVFFENFPEFIQEKNWNGEWGSEMKVQSEGKHHHHQVHTESADNIGNKPLRRVKPAVRWRNHNASEPQRAQMQLRWSGWLRRRPVGSSSSSGSIISFPVYWPGTEWRIKRDDAIFGGGGEEWIEDLELSGKSCAVVVRGA